MVRTMLQDGASAERWAPPLVHELDGAGSLSPRTHSNSRRPRRSALLRTAGRELRGRHPRMPVAGSPADACWRATACASTSGSRTAGARRLGARSRSRPTRSRRTPVGASLVVAEFDGAVSALEATPRTTLRIVGVYEPRRPAPVRRPAHRPAAEGRLRHHAHVPRDPHRAGDVAPGRPVAWTSRSTASTSHSRPTAWASTRSGRSARRSAGWSMPHGRGAAASHASETVTVRSELPAMAEEARVGQCPGRGHRASPDGPDGAAARLCPVARPRLRRGPAPRRGRRRPAARARVARRAPRLLLDETLPPVVVGAPLGALLAVGLCTLARRTVLTSDPPFEVPVAAVVALVAGLALMVVLAVLSVRRASAGTPSPTSSAASRRGAWDPAGVLEAMLVAGAAAAFIALVTGSVQGTVGQLAPTARSRRRRGRGPRPVLSPSASGGRRLLQAGRPTAGAAPRRAGEGRPVGSSPSSPLPSASSSSRPTPSPSEPATGPAGRLRGRGRQRPDRELCRSRGGFGGGSGGRPPWRARHAGGRRLAGRAGRGDHRRCRPGRLPPYRAVAGRPGRHPRLGPADRPDGAAAAPHRHPGRVPPRGVRDQRRDPGHPATPTSLALGFRVVRPDGTVDSVALGTIPAGGIPRTRRLHQLRRRVPHRGRRHPRPPNSAAVTGVVTVSGLTVDGRPVELGGAGPGATRSPTTSSCQGRSPTPPSPSATPTTVGQGVPPPRPSPTSSRP